MLSRAINQSLKEKKKVEGKCLIHVLCSTSLYSKITCYKHDSILFERNCNWQTSTWVAFPNILNDLDLPPNLNISLFGQVLPALEFHQTQLNTFVAMLTKNSNSSKLH